MKVYVAGAITYDSRVWIEISEDQMKVWGAIYSWNRSGILAWNSAKPVEFEINEEEKNNMEKLITESIQNSKSIPSDLKF